MTDEQKPEPVEFRAWVEGGRIFIESNMTVGELMLLRRKIVDVVNDMQRNPKEQAPS